MAEWLDELERLGKAADAELANDSSFDARPYAAHVTALRNAAPKLIEIARRAEELYALHPASEYHEDYGTVLWWHVPVCEPPYVGPGEEMDERTADGEPTDCAQLQREGWLTHWSRIPNISGEEPHAD